MEEFWPHFVKIQNCTRPIMNSGGFHRYTLVLLLEVIYTGGIGGGFACGGDDASQGCASSAGASAKVGKWAKRGFGLLSA
jgi:hypothetical protein